MAEQTITLNLSITEVNIILEALGKEPFAKVYQLVGSIQDQAQQQLNGAVSSPAAAGEDSNLSIQS